MAETHRTLRRRQRIEIDGRMVHPRAPHGTVSGYGSWCCRCLPCTDAYLVSRGRPIPTRCTGEPLSPAERLHAVAVVLGLHPTTEWSYIR